MKYLLEEDYEFDFNLLGICCHEKDYRLCWAVNSTLNLNLSKASEDIELIFNKESKPDANFSIYSYHNKFNSEEYYLISNKCQRTWLVPEKSHFDFFLMVKSDEKKSYNFYLNKLRSIPFILTANHVVVEQLKSKENLIF
jgi:hypothetical protein|tara:strand:- start:2320 stop:2739 length:420 start_codon:yes stop_codon:yes gene_type:complete